MTKDDVINAFVESIAHTQNEITKWFIQCRFFIGMHRAGVTPRTNKTDPYDGPPFILLCDKEERTKLEALLGTRFNDEQWIAAVLDALKDLFHHGPFIISHNPEREMTCLVQQDAPLN